MTNHGFGPLLLIVIIALAGFMVMSTVVEDGKARYSHVLEAKMDIQKQLEVMPFHHWIPQVEVLNSHVVGVSTSGTITTEMEMVVELTEGQRRESR